MARKKQLEKEVEPQIYNITDSNRLRLRLESSNLKDTAMKNVAIDNYDLRTVCLENCIVEGSTFKNVNMQGCNMSDASVKGNTFIDCDLRDSLVYCAERIWPRLASGGCILFDDYNSVAHRGAVLGGCNGFR